VGRLGGKGSVRLPPRHPGPDGGVALNVQAVAEHATRLLDAIEQVIVGKRAVLERVLWAALSDGHLLIEDVPGVAKTLIAKSFASALGLSFRRVQFTPDLLPADITGTYILNRGTGEFVLRRGPVFTNVLLADEINRAPPKTQSALLEAMQERQTTLEGETHRLEPPFFVIATQNPIELEGTYPLPEAQLDRFLMRIDVGYPQRGEEVEMLRRRRMRRTDDAPVPAVLRPGDMLALQGAVEDVHVDPAVEAYMVDLVAATRGHSAVEIGASPRGSLALVKAARARAAVEGRDFVTPDDVKAVASPTLAHRILLKPDPWIRGVRTATVVTAVLAQVPVPKVP
jgi:MoxR-like ATPase